MIDELLIGKQVEERLGVSKRTLATLTSAGFLHPRPLGTALVYDPTEVQALELLKSQRPVSNEAPPAWIVRLGPPGREDDGHPLGWLVGREDNVDAARKYWKIADPEAAEGSALVALVGPLVVGVWNISLGILHPQLGPTGRAEFEVDDATADQVEAYSNRWLNLGRGPTTLRWPREAN